MANKDKHMIMKNYLKNHSLVESNTISFNNFVEKKMQDIVDEVSESLQNQTDDFEINLGKID